jgi:ABC-type enterobactin transport system permease subunit
MKGLLGIGIVLLIVGGALMVMGSFTYKDTDPVIDLGKVEITKTTTKERRIPIAVSATVMGVGAALAIVGALKKGK